MEPTVLLCPPVFYDVVYSINPWMQGVKVDKPIAMDQWFKLKNTLEVWGIKTELISQKKDLPDMVFTANAGTVLGNKVVLSNFRFEERSGETDVFEEWFIDHGYETHRLPKKIKFEGCGDTIIHGDKMIAGYGFRSELGGLRRAAKILGLELIPLKLRHPTFYHLDTCFCLISKQCAIYYPGAFTPSALRKIRALNLDLIATDVTDSAQFACNSIVYNENILMPSGPSNVVKQLEDRGYVITQINTSEFLKSGGSLQCMTLWI
ncbi:MAG TPA: amidinotransferase [Flavobacteriales bacterium]|nr:amidinotransferase [Flavobacteriales bacterium]